MKRNLLFLSLMLVGAWGQPVCAGPRVPEEVRVSETLSKRPVKGRITDLNGESIIGATIVVKGTSVGTVSDVDGRFRLAAVEDNAILVVTYIGYKPQEVTADKSELAIVLKDDTQLLDEVVVTGYGTLKKTQLVGAVENLSGEALDGRATSSVTRSLQGQIPGLNIIQVDGKPSHQGQIYIRGGNTSYNTRKSMGSAEGTYQSIGQGGSANPKILKPFPY